MPTIKQKLAMQKIVENGGKSVSAAMREVGYSPATAENPDKLTESKGWKELLDHYLPDDKLLKTHDEALKAQKWNDFTGEREPDHTVRLKAVDMGYKVKGRLADTTIKADVKVLVLAGEALEKYAITPDTERNSQGQDQIQGS